MLRTLIAASLLPLTLGAAHAGVWQPTPGQDADAPRAVYAETDAGTALLTCNGDGKFTAILSQVTEDFAATMEKQAPYRRPVNVAITMPDREIESKWVSIPAIDTIISASHGNAVKIFNSVVRGDALDVNVEGKAFVSLELPAVDDSFKAFAKTCRS